MKKTFRTALPIVALTFGLWRTIIGFGVFQKPGMAFTSCPGVISSTGVILSQQCVTGHYNITIGGAGQMGFSWGALSRLADANVGVDSKETAIIPSSHWLRPNPNYYDPTHHFDHPPGLPHAGITEDQQAFVNARTYTLKEMNIAIANLNTGRCTQAGLALDAMGRALHALQDSYSHSNYVDAPYFFGAGGVDQAAFDTAVLDGSKAPPNGLMLTLYGFAGDPENPTGNCSPSASKLWYCHESWAKDYPGKNPISGSISGDYSLYVAASQAAQDATGRLIAKVKAAVGPNWNLVTNYGTLNACQQPQPPCSTCSPINRQGQGVTSGDPNDKAGSQGVGPQQFVSGITPLRYAVFFANEPTATAPAQTVTITDPLPLATLDRSTFSFGPIVFGAQVLVPPPGTTYSTTVDLRPATNLLVAVSANANSSSGQVSWKFTSLDPATGKPTTDATAGFLPPGGSGSVAFTVGARQGLAAGTLVQNQAVVIFDSNAPLNTPTWSNAIDNTAPSSKVLPLFSNQDSSAFRVVWEGTDVGAGVQDYTVFVSDNGGSFLPWLTNVRQTSGSYHGVAGHGYGFYSIARDIVGNVEVAKSSAEATTTVSMTPTCASDYSDTVIATQGGFRYNNASKQFVQTVLLTNIGPSSIVGPVSLVLDSLSPNATLSGSNGSTSCSAPSGSFYINVEIGPSNALAMGQQVSVSLKFDDPKLTGITYAPRVLAGPQGR